MCFGIMRFGPIWKTCLRTVTMAIRIHLEETAGGDFDAWRDHRCCVDHGLQFYKEVEDVVDKLDY